MAVLVCSGISLQCEIERRQQSEEEEEDGENTSSSSQEFEDVGLREEKALSDMIHEIKVYFIKTVFSVAAVTRAYKSTFTSTIFFLSLRCHHVTFFFLSLPIKKINLLLSYQGQITKFKNK